MLNFAKELLAAFEKVCPVSKFQVSASPDGKWDTDRIIIVGQLEDGRKLTLTLNEELPNAD